MNRDQIERALRGAGPREDGYLPSTLPVSIADGPRQRGWGAKPLAVAQLGLVAAAVAAGVMLAVLLTGGGPGAPGNVGAGGSSSSPSTVASASPASIAACHAEDFAWTTDAWDAGAGSRGTTVLARGVTGLTSCVIDGGATIVLRAGRSDLLSVQAPASTIEVKADTMLEVGISWSNWCDAQPIGPLSMWLTLPGDTVEVPLVPASGEILVPPCMGAGQPSVLNATDFQPSDRTPPEG